VHVTSFLHQPRKVAHAAIERDEGLNAIISCSREELSETAPTEAYNANLRSVGIGKRLRKSDQKGIPLLYFTAQTTLEDEDRYHRSEMKLAPNVLNDWIHGDLFTAQCWDSSILSSHPLPNVPSGSGPRISPACKKLITGARTARSNTPGLGARRRFVQFTASSRGRPESTPVRRTWRPEKGPD
jgi:hypothetical protein